ncbi:murein transglycosylase A [Buchnera aphidicola (Hyadaphis tataricae)]|uniref:peptidoglycan lytic exotransglycosylase n=1 Tax=Buchnera aphidicola (Hyadaphis tataricae) TaxID=1241859 RepID=A0A4D6Y751_9GAMM|nr:murein transglycosylase A [Buchnera aphidicola]QCI21740.1 murein transglycosylase A [Buchnera aphidicola (Hyadaphis tataricae)]
MKKITKIIFLIFLYTLMISCVKLPIDQRPIQKKKLIKNCTITKKINIHNNIINSKLFLTQIEKIKKFAPSLYLKNQSLYKKITNWLNHNTHITDFRKFGITVSPIQNSDKYRNIKITGYYTPIIEARKNRQNNFQYPIYSMPLNLKKLKKMPTRKEIYKGVLDKKYILAYSNSLIDNFIMEIQGSAFISYGNNTPLKFFSYAGQNGWSYKSIGQILINRGEIKKSNMSMQTIKNWCKKHTIAEIQELFEENPSFVFFKETQKKEVYGSSAVPLIPKTAIAVDNTIIKKGSVFLLKTPILNKKGVFINEYEMSLVIALDVGGAIKGHHFDIYQGIGKKSGNAAGFYNHYGNAWMLN